MTPHPKTFELVQLIKNPGTGEYQQYPFETYETLSLAKAAAKKEMKKSRWAIVAHQVIAMSDD